MHPTLRRLLGRSPAPPPPDLRGGRVLAVIECHLNPNVRDAGAARHTAYNAMLLQHCHAAGVGLVQLPCPEVACLGPQRARPAGQTLHQAMQTATSRQRCSQLAADAADRLHSQVQAGCQLLAVVGGNAQSPGCAVHAGAQGLQPASGVLMQALQPALRSRGLDPPFVPLRDDDAGQATQDLAQLQTLMQPATGDQPA